MQDTATRESGPVDAPASLESVTAEIEAGGAEAPASNLEDVTQELVNEVESDGQADKAPETEDNATDPIEKEEPESEEATPDDETASEDTADQADPDEPKYTVKVNGEEREVPLSELQKGYSRTEDYKAKTMALADERRALEQAKATVEQDVQGQYANELTQRLAEFEALDPVLMEARQIDWDRLKAEDPATFVQYSEAVNQRLALIDQHRGQIAQIEQAQASRAAETAQAELSQRMDMAANKIVEMMPELTEGDSFQRFATDNIAYLRETGFTPNEIQEAVDDRALMLADKARKWDAHQAAIKSLPARKVVPKSAVRPLTSDGTSSAAPQKRFPTNASREAKGDWIVNEILNSE